MRFRKDEDDNFVLDLTPMIDVVFLLLIFFMVSTVFVDFNRRMEISLPSSKSSVVDEIPKTLNIEVTADKQIFFNEKKISLKDLESELASLPELEKKNAVIRADKNLPYGEVIGIMGTLQSAHVLDISVAVK